MKMYNKISWCVFILILPVLFIFIKDKNYPITGDGKEYILMSQSLLSHGSPDLRPDDAIRVLEQFKERQPQFRDGYLECATSKECLAETNNVINYNYFKSINNKYYSWHFFAYSLLNAPVYYFYQSLNASPTASFAFLNAALLLLAIVLIITKLRESVGYKAIILFLTITPTTLSYVRWNHPESITFSAIIVSLILLKKRNYFSSSFVMVICSMQNPPLAFAAMIVFLLSAYKNIGVNKRIFVKIKEMDRELVKHICFGAIISILILLPTLFYYYNFKESNLIVSHGFSDAGLISGYRLYDFYFDLNQGMLLLIPAPMILLITGLVINCFKANKLKKDFLVFLLIILSIVTAIPCLTTINWNPGGEDVLRYVYWNSVFIIFAFAEVYKNLKPRVLKMAALVLFVLSHLTILALIMKSDWFARDAVQLSKPALYTLKNYPALYNPTAEIIVERTLNFEAGSAQFFKGDRSLVVLNRGYAVKAIGREATSVNDCDHSSLSHQGDIYYVNFGKKCKLLNDNISGIITYPFIVAGVENPIVYNTPGLNYSMGWSVVENGFRWSDGKTSYITFGYNKDNTKNIKIYGFKYNNDTKFKLFLNGNKIYDGALTLSDGSITVDPGQNLLNGNNVLRFEWNHPADPSDGDFRRITFALQKIEFQ